MRRVRKAGVFKDGSRSAYWPHRFALNLHAEGCLGAQLCIERVLLHLKFTRPCTGGGEDLFEIEGL